MKISKLIAVLLLAVMLVPAAAFAASPWKDQGGSYITMAKNKLDFGFRNLLGGWSELITQPIKHKDNIGVGLGKGVYNAAAFTLGGVLHTATFPVTVLDVPLPDNGVQF